MALLRHSDAQFLRKVASVYWRHNRDRLLAAVKVRKTEANFSKIGSEIMPFHRILAWIKPQTSRTGKKSRRGRSRNRSFHSWIEALEDRRLMTSVTMNFGGNYNFNSFAGVGFQRNTVTALYASVNGEPDTNRNDFTAKIQWGDGATSTGELVPIGATGTQGMFLIKGSHDYEKTSTGYATTITVTGPGGSSFTASGCRISVSAMPSGIPGTQPESDSGAGQPENVSITFGQVGTINTYAGVGFDRNEVATLYASLNNKPDANLDDFQAQINWGDDDSWTPAELVYVGSNTSQAEYLVKGSHIYSTPSTGMPFVIYATGPDGTSASASERGALVSEMPSGLPGTPPESTETGEAENVQLTLGTTGNISAHVGVGLQDVPVATLFASLNGKPDASLSDGHVKINWGDDSNWSDGELVYQSSNSTQAEYLVLGSHTYESPDQGYPIVIDGIGHDGTTYNGLECWAAVDTNAGITLGDLNPDEWTVNRPGYVGDIDVEGGVKGYQNLQVTGLPAGLSATLVGGTASQESSSPQHGDIVISGTPLQAGTFLIGVSLQDGNGNRAAGSEVLTVDSTISLGNLSPTQWVVNKPGYDGTVGISGGSGEYRNLQVSGLPSGLSASISGNVIEITGTPTQSGAFNLNFSIQDSTGASATGKGTLLVTASSLSLTPTTLPNATAGQRFSLSISAVGGSGQYSFAKTAGTLPSGITLTNGGLLSGTANVAGTYNFTVQATDVAISGLKGTQAYTLIVNPAAAASITVTAPTTATAGTAFKVTVTAKDPFGNKYNGAITLTSSNGEAVSPSTLTLTGGAGSTNVTLTKAGITTLSAIAGTASGRSNSITISPAAVYTVKLNAPTSSAAGTGFSVTVNATDKFGNGVNGTVKLTASDGQAVTPSSVAVKTGTGTAVVTLKNADLVQLTGSIGTVTGQSSGTNITTPALDASKVLFSLSASFNADPEIQKAAIDLFNQLAPNANDFVKLSGAIYHATSQGINTAINAAKGLLNTIMPKPAPGTNDFGTFVKEIVHGGLDTLLDDLKLVTQAVLFNQQPKAVQVQEAIKAAQLTSGAAKNIAQYVAQNPQQAVTNTMKFLQGQIAEIQQRPAYFGGSLLANAAITELSEGTGAIGPIVGGLSKLEQFGLQETETATQLLASGAANQLQGQATSLVGTVATQAARDLNLQRLLNYTQGLTARLNAVLNPQNGRLNCFLVAEQAVNYFRGGAAAVTPVSDIGPFMNPEGYIQKMFGAEFSTPTTIQNADQALLAASKNADYGIAAFEWSGGGMGHAINWFNLNGKIVYLDFQLGEMYTAETLSAAYGAGNLQFVNLTGIAPRF
jgi:Putative Ig domain